MTKKKFPWLFLILLAAATVLTVAVTLGVCFSNQEDELYAPGFTYTGFSGEMQLGDTSYVVSSAGDLLAMEGMYEWQEISLDKETMVWGWEDRTFTVVGKYGVQSVNKQVNRLTYAAIFLSHYGDAVYFIDNEEFHGGQNSLWRFDVASGHVQKIDTIETYLGGGMVSPSGNYFALLEVGDKVGMIHLYDKGKKVKSYPTDSAVTLYFVTDNGTVFYEDAGVFQSVRGTEEPVVYEVLQDNVESILFNRDCTEILVNCAEGGCYFYQLEDDVVKNTVQLKKTGGLTVFTDANDFFTIPTIKLVENENRAVLDVASFRDINLKDAQTGERVKLTADNQLVYQEGSAYMKAILVPGGTFLYYIDANDDYFYTDTEDVNGEYKLLWEASQCDVSLLIDVTAHKSVYYVDNENNVHYVKNGKDKVICPADIWETMVTYHTNFVEDALYFVTDDGVYYSAGGNACRLLFDWGEDTLPEEVNEARLQYAGGYVYCLVYSYDASVVSYRRLYADGTFWAMEMLDESAVPAIS